MKPALIRTSLPVKLADLIEQGLRRGQWADGLPGYRKLAEEYDVSWRTVIAALKLVESRGLIKAPAKGHSRAPSSSAVQAGTQTGNLLILCSEPHVSDLTLRDEIHHIRTLWEKQRGHAHLISVDYARHRRPATFLRSMKEKHRAVALVLAVPPGPWIRAAVDTGFPVYCIGGEQSGIQGISGDGYPIGVEIETSVRRLRALGHRRILIPSSPGSDRMLQCIRAAMVLGGDGEYTEEAAIRFCPVFQETVPAVWQSYWAATFAKLHPSAVVCLREKWVFSLYGFCAARCLRIPQDISVISMTASESLDWCHPRPVSMEYPSLRSLANFKAWMRGGCLPMGFKQLRLQVQEGDSLAAFEGSDPAGGG